MNVVNRFVPLRVALALAVSLMAGAAYAQSVTTAFEGFSGRSDEPVKIEADNLEVREKDEAAIFTGNVVVVQGQSTLRAAKLTIYYLAGATERAKQEADKQQKPAEQAAIPTGRDIRKLEAEGEVIVTSNEQRATGRRGVFDMQANTVVLTGDVVVAQGQNVLRGERLVVDLTTQRSRLESGGGSGRVQGVFVPGSRQPGQGKP